MSPANRKTSTASRGTLVGWRWIVAPFVFPASAVLAAFVAPLPDDPDAAISETSLVGIAAILIAGGVVAGLVVGREGVSRRAFLIGLLTPLPTVLIGYFAMGALMAESEDDLLEAGWLALRLLALWEVPLAVTLLAVGAIQRRATETLVMLPSGPPPLDGELNAATNKGRAGTVVREYVDDEEGRSHLDADADALAAHGYDLVSVERRPGWPKAARVAWWLISIPLDLFLRVSDPDDGAPRLVATFRLRHPG